MHLATFLGLRPLPRGVGGTNTHTPLAGSHPFRWASGESFGGVPAGRGSSWALHARELCRNVLMTASSDSLFEVLLIFSGGSSA